MRTVGVIPLHRWPLEPCERWSLERFVARSSVGHLVAVGPEELRGAQTRLDFVSISTKWFASRDTYSHLLMTTGFYELFQAFEAILIFQPDALWLGTGHEPFDFPFDYVGAPWLRTRGVPSSGFGRVGNGGLSLRRVDRFLAVLRGQTQPATFLEVFRGDAAPDLVSLPLLARLIKALRLTRTARAGVAAYTRDYTLNEDRFWSDRATVFDRSFRVASVEQGLRFSFEEAPRLAYEMNGRRLPLGAHAWQLYDPDFWYEMVPDLPRAEAS